ncbi:arginine repressor [Photobacterium kishitanii]|uniref:Arginine repressor n=1 Tax=Photobacterium kishitanii TaxID=318456 RepID=A0A2T3KD43_9GAMM|nr:arginine repressor [Photobacterium kishitanii]KJG09295.1 arginine repressor [Photobacterium kishitanii]KJG59276.1 arginine repressor [Photobacterium kishitanii]KJG62271.1 arginine repressor [Photobacterium kishitanii]KJG67428.1 arginine repressor [Photobacterium kishitanii]KJG69373.1 arginine repressor [Photobacterium kishitanii]
MDTQLPAIDDNYCNDNMTSACKRLLQQQSFTTQDDIRHQLIKLGFNDISQSTVSRLLLRLGVTKVPNATGKKIYCLTTENEPIKIHASIASQIEFITHNQLVIVIKTHPGGAQLVARLIDMQPHVDILGTIGGNDTVMVAPKDIMRINQCLQVVKQYLGLK